MKFIKKIIWVLFFGLLLNISFAIGIQTNEDFTFFTLNEYPTVKINITAGSQNLYVAGGKLNIDGVDYLYEDDARIVRMFSSDEFVFEITQNLLGSQDITFDLLVTDKDDNPVSPEGDPTSFFLKFDNTAPEISKITNNLIEDTPSLSFEFNEIIHSFDIYIDNELVTQYSNVFASMVLEKGAIDIDFSDFNFEKEEYSLRVEFKDLAGNVNSDVSSLYIPSAPLTIDLITRKDDVSLNYNYDVDFKTFFNKTIYRGTDDIFLFKIQTNKPAECFFSSSLLEFESLNKLTLGELEKFTTIDNLTHMVNLDQYDVSIWVACRNIFYEQEIVYLNDILGYGASLINVEKYDGASLEILNNPASLLTTLPFSLFIQTNEKAICSFDFDNAGDVLMDGVANYLNHSKTSISKSEGSHLLDFECFDVLHNSATKSLNVEIDVNKGVEVVDFTPRYTSGSTANVVFTLSEYDGVECRYSESQIGINLPNYNALSLASGSGFERNFVYSSLSQGENDVFVYCKKDSFISEFHHTVLYDSEGISISNFTFVNNGYESDYVSSIKSLRYNFDIESLIPIDRYLIEVFVDDEVVDDSTKSSNSGKISGDFEGATDIKITAINELDAEADYTHPIKFDLLEPVISFVTIGGGKRVACTDLESGCAEILYGMSQTNIDCKPNIVYNNTILDISDKNYLCVKAYDFAGHEGYAIETLRVVPQDSYDDNSTQTGGGFIDHSDDIDDIDDDIDNTDNTDDDTSDAGDTGDAGDDDADDTDDDTEPMLPIDRPISDDGSNTTTFLLIGAIIVILATGGSGYYAYSKGYLDNELKKLGIKIKPRNKKLNVKSASDNDSLYSSVNTNSNVNQPHQNQISQENFTSTPIQGLDNSSLNRPKADEHLDKLNKFIDQKITKSDDVFDNFNKTNKGKVKGYEDTLMKKTKVKKNELSAEDFDEFYEKSKVNSLKDSLEVKENIIQEAESFEKFYEKRQKSEEDTTKDVGKQDDRKNLGENK